MVFGLDDLYDEGLGSGFKVCVSDCAQTTSLSEPD